MHTSHNCDLPKPIITPKQSHSPELEQTLIALELALTVLEDMEYLRSAEGEKLKERLRQEMNP